MAQHRIFRMSTGSIWKKYPHMQQLYSACCWKSSAIKVNKWEILCKMTSAVLDILLKAEGLYTYNRKNRTEFPVLLWDYSGIFGSPEENTMVGSAICQNAINDKTIIFCGGRSVFG
jgi:hypothetical protein